MSNKWYVLLHGFLNNFRIIDHYPKGEYGPEGKSLAFYLRLADVETTPRVYAEFTLSVLNQTSGKHREHAGELNLNSSETLPS